MRVRVLPSAAEAALAAADAVTQAAASRPGLVLGLPTGRTPIAVYDELARRHLHGRLALGRAHGFNLDELLLPSGHPASFRAYMERHAWERIGLDRNRCDIPDPAADPAADRAAECRRYDRALAAAGGLDLALLGVGADGHVAYNLPGASIEGTHVVELPAELAEGIEVPAGWRPLSAITVGLAALRGARRLVLLATGAAKAPAIAALLRGPADPRWPCTLLRDHPSFDVLLGPEAAGGAG